MKNLLIYLLAAMLVVVILYTSISFTKLEIDFRNWSEDLRFGFIILSLILVVFVLWGISIFKEK